MYVKGQQLTKKKVPNDQSWNDFTNKTNRIILDYYSAITLVYYAGINKVFNK